MIKYTVQYGVSAVLLSMQTNRFLHKRVLPCVCISGPPHRLLCKERKGFISLIYTIYGLYAQTAVLQALRLMPFFSLSNDIKKRCTHPLLQSQGPQIYSSHYRCQESSWSQKMPRWCMSGLWGAEGQRTEQKSVLEQVIAVKICSRLVTMLFS